MLIATTNDSIHQSNHVITQPSNIIYKKWLANLYGVILHLISLSTNYKLIN